jgi:NADH:ubiquinone oxidoreductase subunit D
MIAKLQYEGDMLKSAAFQKGFQERPLWTKLQTLTPAEMILWVDRFDSLSSISSEWALAQAFEKSYGLEIPKRTQYVRSILCEVNRLIWLTTYLGRVMKALGGLTLYQEIMVLREQTLSAQEELTGGRILPQALCLGGCRRDLALGHIERSCARFSNFS